MIVLQEWRNFRLVWSGADFTLEVDVGIGPEGRYWIPASGMQVFDFIQELGEWLLTMGEQTERLRAIQRS